MRRGSGRGNALALPFTGTLLLISTAFPTALTAEGHYANPHRNCRAEAAISLPLRKGPNRKGPPPRAGWHLRNSGELVFVQGTELTALDPTTGNQTAIAGGFSLDEQVQAAEGPSGIYTLTAPALSGASTAAVVLSAYSPNAYQLLWAERPFGIVNPPFITMPLATSNRVFAGAGKHITVRDASNGREVWSRTLESIVGWYPALIGQTVVLPTTDGIEALSLANGKTLWRYPMDRGSFNPSRPITGEGSALYLPLTERTIAALDLKSGGTIWESPPLPQPIDFQHPVMVDSSGVFVPLYRGLAHLDSSGSLIWAKNYPFLKLRRLKPSVILAENAVFLGGADGLYAVSRETGEILWSEEGLGQIMSIEYFEPDLIAVDSRGMVYTFSP